MKRSETKRSYVALHSRVGRAARLCGGHRADDDLGNHSSVIPTSGVYGVIVTYESSEAAEPHVWVSMR